MLNQSPTEPSRLMAPPNVSTGLSNSTIPSQNIRNQQAAPFNGSHPIKPPQMQPTVQVRTVFMDEQMQAKAIELAKEACMSEKMSVSPREIAGHLKLAFDEMYGPAWHCVVGRSYGSFVTHEKESFIFFYVDHWAIMLFKTA